MSVFTAAEIDYLNSQPLGRLATAGADGRPHVVPVAFQYNVELDTVDIGGYRFAARKKFRDARENPWAAIVVDDLVSTDPWRPRMLEIRGRAETPATGGAVLRPGFDDAMLRIHPTVIAAFGLDDGAQSAVRRV